jgi:hypothetical protein
MGLDMYLYAQRSFAADSPDAEQILLTAGVTLNQLRAMSQANPMEQETYVYLARWEYMRGSESAEYELATRVHERAGLLPFAITDSGGGGVGYADGKINVWLCCAYWRKANSVHGWFVDRCQGGVDECQRTKVHPEALAFLRATCLDALDAYDSGDATKAAEIMQPRSGFFFGATDVDEWWVQDMRSTVRQVDRALALAAEIGGVDFYYQASW